MKKKRKTGGSARRGPGRPPKKQAAGRAWAEQYGRDRDAELDWRRRWEPATPFRGRGEEVDWADERYGPSSRREGRRDERMWEREEGYAGRRERRYPAPSERPEREGAFHGEENERQAWRDEPQAYGGYERGGRPYRYDEGREHGRQNRNAEPYREEQPRGRAGGAGSYEDARWQEEQYRRQERTQNRGVEDDPSWGDQHRAEKERYSGPREQHGWEDRGEYRRRRSAGR